MSFQSPPYLLQNASVTRVMAQVCLALIPALAVYATLITPAILVQLLIASIAALLFEGVMLTLRGKPLALFLTDGSALVTAWLITLAFPPLSPWWLTVTGVFFAIVVAKHLYGGLGQNPFNPAMVAFAVCIVSFPALMANWPTVGLDKSLGEQAAIIFGTPTLDAISSATPLDALKTALRVEAPPAVGSVLANADTFGQFAGRGWEWVALAYLLGGAFLLARKLITWHIPLAYLGAMGLISGALWLYAPDRFANPLFHLFTGSTMLGAFFIATDPVSGCTTPRGKLIFAGCAALLAYVIRVFGGYPDGVAFGILLMNLCAPLIDLLSQPRIFGMKDKA